MRHLLRKLRKNIKRACLTAALVTCWGIGQTAQADLIPPPDYGDEVTMHFSGTISPASTDVSHVYLIYGTGYSPTNLIEFGAVKLGDFLEGQTTQFSVYATAEYQDYFGWIAVGLHGDISGGQYVEGLNGVSLAHPYMQAGYNWDSYVYTDIDVMFGLLFNDDIDQLADEHVWYWYADNKFDASYTNINLWNFSTASQNGQMQLETEMVPEPITLALFGAGSVLVMASRRKKD